MVGGEFGEEVVGGAGVGEGVKGGVGNGAGAAIGEGGGGGERRQSLNSLGLLGDAKYVCIEQKVGENKNKLN